MHEVRMITHMQDPKSSHLCNGWDHSFPHKYTIPFTIYWYVYSHKIREIIWKSLSFSLLIPWIAWIENSTLHNTFVVRIRGSWSQNNRACEASLWTSWYWIHQLIHLRSWLMQVCTKLLTRHLFLGDSILYCFMCRWIIITKCHKLVKLKFHENELATFFPYGGSVFFCDFNRAF